MFSQQKRVGADMLDIAALEIGNALTKNKEIKSVSSDVGRKTLGKQLVGGKNGKRRIIQRIPPKTSRRRLARRDYVHS